MAGDLKIIDSDFIGKIAEELNLDLRETAQWLVKLAQDAGAAQTYYGRIKTPIPIRSSVRFWLANVDDEATLRCEGLFKKVHRGDAPLKVTHTLGTRGANVVILTLKNSGGFDYRVDFVMDVRNIGRAVNHTDKGSDIPPYGLQRNYIWRFDVR